MCGTQHGDSMYIRRAQSSLLLHVQYGAYVCLEHPVDSAGVSELLRIYIPHGADLGGEDGSVDFDKYFSTYIGLLSGVQYDL